VFRYVIAERLARDRPRELHYAFWRRAIGAVGVQKFTSSHRLPSRHPLAAS